MSNDWRAQRDRMIEQLITPASSTEWNEKYGWEARRNRSDDSAGHLRNNVTVTREDLVTWLLAYRESALSGGFNARALAASEPEWLNRVPIIQPE